MKRNNLIALLLGVVLLPGCAQKSVADRPETEADGDAVATSTSVKIEPVSAVVSTKIEATKEPAVLGTGSAIATIDDKSKKDTAKVAKAAHDAEREVARLEKANGEAENVARKKLADLNKEYSAATKKWMVERRKARTAEDARAVGALNPANDFGPKFLALAEEVSDTKTYFGALRDAVMKSTGEAKDSAMAKMLELSAASKDETQVLSALKTLTQSGTGESQVAAMNQLVATAEEDLESKAAMETLTLVASSRVKNEAKEKAVDLIFGIAKSDLRSNKAAKALGLVEQFGTGETRSKALGYLAAHHGDSDALMGVLTKIPRAMPSAENEKFLKEMCEKGQGKVKGNAMIALAQYISRRDSLRTYIAGAEEKALKSFDEEMLAYAAKEPDANEMADLELMLDSFVTDHQPLLEKAEGQLFVMKNLSIGKTAPEITANDLNGQEFSLSDYRGKVVFLDFWGDW